MSYYLYDVINNATKQEYKGLTCTSVSKLISIPLAEIPWIAKDKRKCEEYTIIPIPIEKRVKSDKGRTGWRKTEDTERWNEVHEAADMLKSGGRIVSDGERKYVVEK